MKYFKNILFILASILSITSFSQQKETDRYISFGPSISSYKGDLNKNYSSASGGFNLMIIPERDKLIQSTIELNIGQVAGQQNGYYSEKYPEYEPSTFFQTNYTSLSFNIRAYFYRRNNFKLYIGQGIGAMRFVPKDVNGNLLIDSINSRHINDDFENNLALILPRYIGASYKLKNGYRVNLDINQQTPRTDFIDNISKLGVSSKKDKILLVRFSIMIPLIYKKENESTSIRNENTM